jgi:hypothetical protein
VLRPELSAYFQALLLLSPIQASINQGKSPRPQTRRAFSPFSLLPSPFFDFFDFAVKILRDFVFLPRFVILCVYPVAAELIVDSVVRVVVSLRTAEGDL